MGMTDTDYDLCVIGGGINGVGIARDAAGRGISVLLLEAKDLACATSSASTKLIHGGLRYLEFFEFRLVKDSLAERETLLAMAPHVIRPMDFVLPHIAGTRPFWLIRLGLYLYDRLARKNRLPDSWFLEFHGHKLGLPLVSVYEKGFCYADCWADDSRLVILNAMDAAARGAEILTYTPCTKLVPHADYWAVEFRDKKSGETRVIRAAMVVNAAGPWAEKIIQDSNLVSLDSPPPKIRLIKGSHIIIPQAYFGEQAYVLQQKDKRIVFVMPYETDYTLIGTTEEAFEGDPYNPMISEDEMEYLCEAFNASFRKNISRADVVWTYSGVRPLCDKASAKRIKNPRALSRDYMFYDHPQSKAPMVSVFGGKLTTYRVLAEQLMNTVLQRDNRYSPPWTAQSVLPGGDMPDGDFDAFLAEKRGEYPWLPAELLSRYARAYGTRMDRFLEGTQNLADLGRDFGAGLYEAEIVYMIRYEFARTAEDILWRRSKRGMWMTDEEVATLEEALPALVSRIVSG